MNDQIYTKQSLKRYKQLYDELLQANQHDYTDRLRAFRDYSLRTSPIANLIMELPKASFNFDLDWQNAASQWPDREMERLAIFWDAITQICERGPGYFYKAWKQFGESNFGASSVEKVTKRFVQPLYNFIVYQLESTNATLHILLRYKRWVEWFEGDRLRQIYQTADKDGESKLDEDLRRFLFESGIDYPFSKPRHPRGEPDVVAQLETDDPLILEIKVYDSKNSYREDRIRDGLRQVINYATMYGKDTGYVVVFNLDPQPLNLLGSNAGEWPARLEVGDRTYFFIAIEIAEQKLPISKRDKGKQVKTNTIQLANLLNQENGL